MGISTPMGASTVDCIRQIHGSAVANELINFEVSNDKLGFKASGWTSNANYHVKRTTVLLFINHRSVESSAIKKAIEQTYSTFLPKGGHPFLYLSLDIEPQRVDVNVHPTKREVNFLNEDEIIEHICDAIRSQLSKVDTSRTFMTQTLLPGVTVPSLDESSDAGTSTKGHFSSRTTPTSASSRPYENNLVRTDSKIRKITSMLPPTTPSVPTADLAEEVQYSHSDRQPVHCRLSSVKELRADVRSDMHATLTEVFASHTYVGLVDGYRRIVAMQGGVKLFLVDYGMVCNEYFYQVGLTDFGNFGSIKFEPALNIAELIRIGVEAENQSKGNEADVAWEEVADLVTGQLIERREMLEEYFSLEISEEGRLLGMPLLMKGYMPSLTKLPRFLMRLGPCVEWQEEKSCFHSFLKELATFYTPEQLPVADDDEADEDVEMAHRRSRLTRMLENVLFPAFRARLVATRSLLKGVIEVANLKGLYKVFERC